AVDCRTFALILLSSEPPPRLAAAGKPSTETQGCGIATGWNKPCIPEDRFRIRCVMSVVRDRAEVAGAGAAASGRQDHDANPFPAVRTESGYAARRAGQ